MKLFFILACLILASIVTLGQAKPDAVGPVEGWSVFNETGIGEFHVSRDKVVRHEGKVSVSLKMGNPETPLAKGVGMMQTVRADDYLNTRVRFSIFIKTAEAGAAYCFMRMDGDAMRVVNIHNMDKTPITGTSDWQKYSIVLAVPPGSMLITFGIGLKNGGQVWIDEATFEAVGLEVDITSSRSPSEIEAGSVNFIENYKSNSPGAYEMGVKGFEARKATLPRKPINLDFEN